MPLLEIHVLAAPAGPLAHHAVVAAHMVPVIHVMVHLCGLHQILGVRLRDRDCERGRLRQWRKRDGSPQYQTRSQ